MLRFVAESPHGRLLFLGLSHDNIALLRADDPIRFELSEYGASGSLCIAAAQTDAALLPEATHQLQLDDETLATLSRGELVDRPDVAELVGFAGLYLFGGASEVEMLEALQQSGLMGDGAAIEGLDEYLLHEANLCPGCPRCGARAAETALEERALLIIADETLAQAGFGPPTRGWRGLVARLLARPNLAVAVGVALLLLVTGAITLAIELGKKKPVPYRLPKASPQTLAYRASDALRRSIVEERPAVVLAPTLSSTRCPHHVAPPRALGPRIIASLARWQRRKLDPTARFAHVVGTYLIFDAQLDILPAKAGIGPLQERLHRDHLIDARQRPFAQPVRRTFVIDAWRDPVLPADLEKRLGAGTTGKDRFRPGLVMGHLLLWSYPERRFVCASPKVTAITPPLTLVSQQGARNALRGTHDDPLAKARLETLLAAVRKATTELRLIAPSRR